MDLNFRLKPGGKAVDAGAAIPTVNDGFTGRAPDLGALDSDCRSRSPARPGSPGSRFIDEIALREPPTPGKRQAACQARDLNFRLKPGGKAVNAGAAIPTVDDGFTGRAPDLGAHELGLPEPRYGPAWLTW
jgi:hypothetical protein